MVGLRGPGEVNRPRLLLMSDGIKGADTTVVIANIDTEDIVNESRLRAKRLGGSVGIETGVGVGSDSGRPPEQPVASGVKGRTVSIKSRMPDRVTDVPNDVKHRDRVEHLWRTAEILDPFSGC